ncbi:hypothetical protein [Magnetovibrio blakemorei]|uniref:Uncharacterized protein n=1 Tax=Magnetovibrio blakemorei TaxID=28181 RepID=A0A1E5Q675_9PROT|nr:hypothetical protein [Magnetovibrio blakemorei]OEJ66077.1 hypothetical protein BEN30_13065 [Magnetovibrio blakemorei]OEJ66114.1 hypothetical protein BEN30_12975 [Magnetovibrio blakemorei]
MRTYLEQVRDGKSGIHLADYRHTHDTLCCIDALVSPLSTILIEGALHGKPVMCFLPNDEKSARHFNLVAPLTHFDDMFSMPEIIVADGQSQLIPKLSELMEHVGDEAFQSQLKQKCSFFVEPFDSPYGDRLVAFLEMIITDFNSQLPMNSVRYE